MYALNVLTILCICMNVSIARRTFFHGNLPPHVDRTVQLPEAKWFDQRLNHFDPTDTTTWKQKYFMNATFYKSGGPLFVMIGGEGPASAKWMVEGAWVEYAKLFKAYMVQVEHRYYGDSHPTQNVSTENLRYLTSEQALADLAYFITDYKVKHDMQNSKVITFGGSYSGALSLWARLKYPHIIHAAVASSAPLLAKVNFEEYLNVVRDSLVAKGSLKCLRAVSKATSKIFLLLQHRIGWKVIEKSFKLCKPFDGSNIEDVANFFELLAENFNDVVQYNEDNRPGNDITIDTLCKIMTDPSKLTTLDKYLKINSMLLKARNEACFNHTYQSMIDKLKKTEWSNDVGGRAWTYQTCTEFGFFQSSDSPSQPFGHKFPIDFFIRQCKDIFGSQFDERFVYNAVKETNIKYGGQNPKVTRVVLVNGSIDPWHILGVTKSLGKEIPAIYIDGTAHCANMYPPAISDRQGLKKARIEINQYIDQWLKE